MNFLRTTPKCFLIEKFLYEKGLTFDTELQVKRGFWFRPFMVTLVVLSFGLQRLTVILFGHHHIILVIMGDTTHYLGIRQLNIVFILLSLMTLFTLSIYYYNYTIGVKPTFLKVKLTSIHSRLLAKIIPNDS